MESPEKRRTVSTTNMLALKKLYTSPEQVYSIYNALAPIGNMFSITAAFGNASENQDRLD